MCGLGAGVSEGSEVGFLPWRDTGPSVLGLQALKPQSEKQAFSLQPQGRHISSALWFRAEQLNKHLCWPGELFH